MTAYVEGDPWSAAGTPVESYRYDAGRFRWMRVGRDGTPVISLRDGSGQPQAEYVITVSGSPARNREYVYGLGQVLAERRVSGGAFSTFFHHRDHLGSLRVLTDAAGLMREAHDYYPYGQEMGGGAPGDDPKKFTGHERDEATGLDYMLARYYGSTIGMFLSPDPLAGSVQAADPLSWNRYSYVRGNPIMRTDPTGEADDNPTEPKRQAKADGLGRPATPGAAIDGIKEQGVIVDRSFFDAPAKAEYSMAALRVAKFFAAREFSPSCKAAIDAAASAARTSTDSFVSCMAAEDRPLRLMFSSYSARNDSFLTPSQKLRCAGPPNNFGGLREHNRSINTIVWIQFDATRLDAGGVAGECGSPANNVTHERAHNCGVPNERAGYYGLAAILADECMGHP